MAAPAAGATPAEASVSTGLGHEFSQLALLRQALTHRSFVHERPDLAPDHNETLEFLGDSVVGLAAATLLRERFPSAREGELTRRRADLVCERTLARVAEKLELGAALRLGRGEERSGGRTKARLLASALEACIAAVLLDADVVRALAVARALLEPFVEVHEPGAEDFKSRVQELLQADGKPTPRYQLVGYDGPEHARTFHVAIHGEAGELARGQGRSKSDAEQAAARAAYHCLVASRCAPAASPGSSPSSSPASSVGPSTTEPGT
jgi:ribonuclease-3